MFSGCSNLTSIDLSKFNTQNVSMDYIFNNCSNLTSIDVSDININNFKKFFNENQLNIKN